MHQSLASPISPQLAAHLRVDLRMEIARLLMAFDRGEVLLIPSQLEQHGQLLRSRHPAAHDTEPVLAVSIGGSQSKAMVASFRGGGLCVHWLRRLANPITPTPWQVFFDDLLLAEAPSRDYLAQSSAPRVGVSLAVMITDGVPHHPTKMPGLSGLIARDLSSDRPLCHFGRNFRDYVAHRTVRPAAVAYRSDAPLAHLGAVAAARPKPDEQTMLLVCGTGMACADDRQFILMGLLPMLDPRNPLHAPAETEEGQYQYLIAGKGLHSFMRRAVELQARWPESRLRQIEASTHFARNEDSRKVRDLWQGSASGAWSVEVADELRAVANAVVERGISVLAASVLASAARTGAQRRVRLFVEGGIATDPAIRQRLQEVLVEHAGCVVESTWQSYTLPQVELDPCSTNARADASVPVDRITHLDLTLWGAAALASTNEAVG